MPGKKRTQKGGNRQFSSVETIKRDLLKRDDDNDSSTSDSDAANRDRDLAAMKWPHFDSDSEVDEAQPKKPQKKKGVADLIEINNPNRKASDENMQLDADVASTTDQRYKPANRHAFKGNNAVSETERMRSDLARLAEVRKKREAVAAQRAAEAAKRAAEAEKAKKNSFKTK